VSFSLTAGRGARRRVAAIISAGALAAGALAAVPSATAAPGPVRASGTARLGGGDLGPGRYVVLLREPAATAYRGGKGDLSATRVAPGQQFDARSTNVAAYARHLRSEQDQLAQRVGARIQRSFTLAANGFTARLTAKQAVKLAGSRDVLLVQKDERLHLDTWNTPGVLGLTGRHGAWKQHAGGRGKAGAGVVVGVLDSGIWPESKSFRGAPLTGRATTKWDISRHGQATRMEKADGGVFHGRCQLGYRYDGRTIPAQRWNRDDCNTKLIGARYYPEEFLDQVAPKDRSRDEFLSARDGGGHGTHTASTAAGRAVRDVQVEGIDFGTVSGMAPGARVAAYKICFDDRDPETGDCYTGATLAAIDDAIADGVDVINFSISGVTDTVIDAVEIAFEGAAEAGIFVATSAGNSGPEESTVAHNSPWVTTVAATTHHNFVNTVVLGNGTRIRGASISQQALPQTRLIRSVQARAVGADKQAARLCFLGGNLDPKKVEGKIVVCERGVNDRVDKSKAVKRAGGVGMILANVEPGSLDADFHSVPTIHVADDDSPKIFRYIKRSQKRHVKATAAFVLGDATHKKPTPVPQVSEFSSRGPALANGSDILKPDLAAPGQSILAAVSPPSNEDRDFDMYSGTSMASPHVAGLAAFMMGVHPSWTPMMVKSAMMTTAESVRTARDKVDTDPFGQGAGEVRPERFFDPGLFVTSDARQWRRFIQGQGYDVGYRPLAAKDLNGPSLAEGEVTSQTSFKRTFVSTRKGTWDVSVHVPGFKAVTRKHLVAKRAGDRESLTVHFKRTTAPLLQFSTGYLVLDGPTRVRLPIALRPVSVAAPQEVSGTGTDGSAPVEVTAGFTGELEIGVTGLVQARTETFTTQNPNQGYDDEQFYCVQVSKGAKAARFDLDAADDEADMDLFVYLAGDDTCSEENLVAFAGQSASASGDERVTLLDPEPGHYLVEVDPFSPAPGKSTLDWRFDFYDLAPSQEVGDLAADPNPLPVVDNRPTSYDAVWSGLTAGSRYLGLFEYDGSLAPTFLTVDTGAGPATPEPTAPGTP
jgi:subtilisin family serine protease